MEVLSTMKEGLKSLWDEHKEMKRLKKEDPARYYRKKADDIYTAESAGLSYVIHYCLSISGAAGLGVMGMSVMLKGYMDEMDANMFKNTLYASLGVFASGIPFGIWSKNNIYKKRDEYEELARKQREEFYSKEL